MSRRRVAAVVILILGALLAYYVYQSEVTAPDSVWHRPFKLGLDLRGGSHLVYEADTSGVTGSVAEAMASLREVIERRINPNGTLESVIQVEQVGVGAGASQRLIVELPGVTDLAAAIKLIDVTPVLEFKRQTTEGKFTSTGLTGRFLLPGRAQVTFSRQALNPSISLEFNDEGAKMFAAITKANIGKPIAIYLDGKIISQPVVREEIRDGHAEISGSFTVDEARELTRNLNLGALPVPIKLVSTETIGATLGESALNKGVRAGLLGFAIVAIFMILWYRLPGVVAVVSLAIYVALMLAIFKLVPITLTAAGIAGFILSVGMAVDANILIFERLKEEMQKAATMHEALAHGFSRAWLSIRDSNLSSIISALILFWFGTTLIKGFALALALGVLVSMLTAITITRTLLLSLGVTHVNRVNRFFFGSGIK